MKRGEPVRFYCRGAGVVSDRGRVLVERLETLDFWTLPGGQVELGETSEDTLRREMLEEIGVKVEVERLLWVAESFYRFEGDPCHEITFYYLMHLPPGCDLRDRDEPLLGAEGPLPLVFKWLSLDTLEQTRIEPAFLRKGLLSLPETIEHLVLAQGTEPPLRPPKALR